jgi:radical SAM superfamily enzyme YgiQ (UPF0313 family)
MVDKIDHLPLELYSINNFAPLYTSFGCPLRCSYCSSHIFNGGYTRRKIRDIIAELDYYYHNLNIKKIAFYDDALLNEFSNHLLPLSEIISQKYPDLIFYTPNGLSIAQLTDNVAHTLKRLNVVDIRLSLETSDFEFQKKLGNKASNRQFEKAVNFLRNSGFSTKEIKVYLLVGLPEQSYNSVKK